MTTSLASAVRGATNAMGTRFEIVVASDEEQRARLYIEAALAEIEDLHRQLTRFSSDSLLSHINRTAALAPVRLDAASFALFDCANTVKRESGGAFDIALGTGSVVLDAQQRTIRLDRPGVALDLGGIAKGFALDCAGAILRAGGIESALLHGGTSSVLAIGAPPGRSAWRVALARCAALPHVELCGQALSVSRPFAQLRDGATHIVNPHTRKSVQTRCIAVVIGPSACLADAWSTALTVSRRRPESLSGAWTTLIEPEDA